MKCDNCPAAWAERDVMTECGVEHGEYGCLIRGLGYSGEGDGCYLKKAQVDRFLRELDDYENGKIKRPKWLVNRFIRDMDSCCVFSGEPGCGLPRYPTIWHNKKNRSLYGSTDMHYQMASSYRKGYEDAKNGKPCTEEYWR